MLAQHCQVMMNRHTFDCYNLLLLGALPYRWAVVHLQIKSVADTTLKLDSFCPAAIWDTHVLR